MAKTAAPEAVFKCRFNAKSIKCPTRQCDTLMWLGQIFRRLRYPRRIEVSAIEPLGEGHPTPGRLLRG